MHVERKNKCTTETCSSVMSLDNQTDFFFFTNHFKNLTRPGIYIDVASNDPIYYSNTYFFDKCLRWRGICVEANDVYHESLYLKRSCHLVPTCVSSSFNQVVNFSFHGLQGGILDTNYKFINSTRFPAQETRSKHCTTMSEIFSRYDYPVIDYMSLDIEGHELEILYSIPWEHVRINVISVETGPRIRTISSFLQHQGFRNLRINPPPPEMSSWLIHYMRGESIFIRNDVILGHPK